MDTSNALLPGSFLAHGAQLGQMWKTHQKFDWKSREIEWLYYAYDNLTYFRYVAHKITGNGNDVNQLKFAWNNSWNHISWIYFWRVLAIGDHCAGVSEALESGISLLFFKRLILVFITALGWNTCEL